MSELNLSFNLWLQKFKGAYEDEMGEPFPESTLNVNEGYIIGLMALSMMHKGSVKEVFLKIQMLQSESKMYKKIKALETAFIQLPKMSRKLKVLVNNINEANFIATERKIADMELELLSFTLSNEILEGYIIDERENYYTVVQVDKIVHFLKYPTNEKKGCAFDMAEDCAIKVPKSAVLFETSDKPE